MVRYLVAKSIARTYVAVRYTEKEPVKIEDGEVDRRVPRREERAGLLPNLTRQDEPVAILDRFKFAEKPDYLTTHVRVDREHVD